MPDPQRLKGLLPAVMSGLGVAAPMQSARLFSKWAEIVGADVAERCRPVSLKDGLLRIKTDSAIWAAEFRYLAPEVIKRVNAELGAPLVREIKLWVDQVHGGVTRPRGSGSRAPEAGDDAPRVEQREQALERPTEKVVRQAEEMVASIQDERLSEAVKKALLAAKMRRRRGV